MKIEVVTEVIACDIDRQTPALTYSITASDGRAIEIDLCGMHGEPIEKLFRDSSRQRAEPEREEAPAPAAADETSSKTTELSGEGFARQAVEIATRRAAASAETAPPAKKTAAVKKAAPPKKAAPAKRTRKTATNKGAAPAKKASSGRGSRVVSLEEIEERKKRQGVSTPPN